MERTRLEPAVASLVVSAAATSILLRRVTLVGGKRIYSYAFLLYRPAKVPYSPMFFLIYILTYSRYRCILVNK